MIYIQQISTLDIVRQPNLKHSVHLIRKYIDYVL